MTKSGQVPTQIIVEDGRDVTYIIINDDIEKEVSDAIVHESKTEPYSLRKENTRLKKEIEELKQEIYTLKKRV